MFLTDSITEYYRVLQSITEYYRVLQSITETNLAHLLGPTFGLVFNRFLFSRSCQTKRFDKDFTKHLSHGVLFKYKPPWQSRGIWAVGASCLEPMWEY